MATHNSPAESESPPVQRRDFLYVATSAVAVVGVAGVAWPLINQLNPDASVLALASIEVDISNIAEGQVVTVMWRGKPIFIRHRTPAEIEEAKSVSMDELPDPFARNANVPDDAGAEDINRAASDTEKWLVLVGVCTHLGCVPLSNQGDFGGWFCPCHGSHYDTAGRIRKGPAPENLHIPLAEFTDATTIKLG